jgi:hypothetical protein
MEGWHTFVTGYFRAPMALGISSRPNPDNPTGPSSMQVSYGPNRTLDSTYYSFAYTRLQEQDWSELFIHEKKKHVEAVVGWMGSWYQSVGVENPYAAWTPGMAYLTLDTDLELPGLKPNIALTAGAFWPKFGYFEKYDTYTLGRMRQMGEQLTLTVPVNSDLKVTVVQGFGTGRDGTFNSGSPALYAVSAGADLVTWENLEIAYKKYVDLGLHYNNQWSADPNMTGGDTQPSASSYTAVQQAHLSTVGAELKVSAPYAGRLWVSPSYISVRNSWALANAGVEVMHSLGGAGIAQNYMGMGGPAGGLDNFSDSTGSGSMFNLGFLYENKLSGILGRTPGSLLPEVTLNVFGLMTNASLDLPSTSKITVNTLNQLKYGADVTVQPLTWLGFMVRYDTVVYDTNHDGYVFSDISPRMVLSSHFLSGESIYLQYSRYFYGDNMKLGATWPDSRGKVPMIQGNAILQQNSLNMVPDQDVIRLQATIAF